MLSKSGGASNDDPYIVASASSDGIVRVWDIRTVGQEKTSPLAEANTKSRLTCLAGSSIKCKCWIFDFISPDPIEVSNKLLHFFKVQLL